MNRSRTIRVFFIAAMIIASGCDTKATREECEGGCTNITTLVYAKLDETIHKDAQGESKERLNKLTMEFAKGMWDYFYDQCVKECEKHQTRKMTECMKNAGSIEEVKACK